MAWYGCCLRNRSIGPPRCSPVTPTTVTEQAAPLVILASASPRRTELLHEIGIQHQVMPAGIDESRLPGETIEECVQRLARLKALQIQRRFQSLPVIGADTVV